MKFIVVKPKEFQIFHLKKKKKVNSVTFFFFTVIHEMIKTWKCTMFCKMYSPLSFTEVQGFVTVKQLPLLLTWGLNTDLKKPALIWNNLSLY